MEEVAVRPRAGRHRSHRADVAGQWLASRGAFGGVPQPYRSVEAGGGQEQSVLRPYAEGDGGRSRLSELHVVFGGAIASGRRAPKRATARNSANGEGRTKAGLSPGGRTALAILMGPDIAIQPGPRRVDIGNQQAGPK